jgi:hypothetical protein
LRQYPHGGCEPEVVAAGLPRHFLQMAA